MDFTAYTNQGSREYNEDNYCIAEYGDAMCFALADGLGGHGGGDVASKTAVTAVRRLFEEKGFSNTFFEDAFRTAQNAIFEEQEKAHNHSKMKTTLTVLVIVDGMAHYAHVGDSRLYILKNKKIKKRTLDHSVPQMLALSGEIRDSDIRHHPDRSRLMHVLGVFGEEARYDIGKPIRLGGVMSFLICSDGYWELVEDKDIEITCSNADSSEDWVNRMNDLICKNGEGTDMDNYSAVAVFVRTKGLFARKVV